MPVTKLTVSPTEADLEAKIVATIQRVFPFLSAGDVKHQLKFSFTFGRALIEVDGTTSYAKQARADVILSLGGKPLAVLELKREGLSLLPEDDAQGISYARVLEHIAPLVIVTNGSDVRLLDSYTGRPLDLDDFSSEQFSKIVTAASSAARSDVKEAIDTLMGTNPIVWRQAVEQATDTTILELTATPEKPGLPFIKSFLIQRSATTSVLDFLSNGTRLTMVEGPPLIGKSNVLRDLVGQTREGLFATLFVEAFGSGIIQSVADALSLHLSWPITRDEARSWLLRLSHAAVEQKLVLAIDSVNPHNRHIIAEIEDLSSPIFGEGVRIVFCVDDAAAERILVAKGGRSPSHLGRRISRVRLDLLDDREFKKAVNELVGKRIGMMPGALSARELRFPWILKSRVWRALIDPRYEDEGSITVLPPIMGLDLIGYARDEFLDDELRRQFHEIAVALFKDTRRKRRPVSLILESMGIFIVRRKKLAKRLDEIEIRQLIEDGHAKPSMHASGEPVLIIRLPELLASELAFVMAAELQTRVTAAPSETAKWISDASSSFPLGAIIAAQSIIDCALAGTIIPREFIVELVKTRPTLQKLAPGSHFAAHMPGAGLLDFTVRDDGALVVKVNGNEKVIEPDPNDGVGAIYDDIHSWMVLSHLATIPAVMEIGGVEERFDPYILMEVGSAPIVLRSVEPDPEFNNVLTHDIKGAGSIVCHEAGIVEPITFAIFMFLEREGREATNWVNVACERNSLPLLARLQIALEFVAGLGSEDSSAFAKQMLDGPVADAFKKHPPLHRNGE